MLGLLKKEQISYISRAQIKVIMTSKDEFHKMVVKSLPGPFYTGTLESYEKWVGKKKKL